MSGKPRALRSSDFSQDSPRIKVAESSQVNPTCVSAAYDELIERLGKDIVVHDAAGYTEAGPTTDDLISEAVQQSKAADLAILFVGLPGNDECEGIISFFTGSSRWS